MTVRTGTIKAYRGPQADRVGRCLKQFVENIAKCSVSYCNMSLRVLDEMDYGLLSNERAVYSLMSAAMHHITPMHQSEMGVIRRVDRRRRGNQGRNKTHSGRVDLWSYSGGMEYFFEFKRSYVSLTSIGGGTIPKKISDSWHTLEDQVDQVRRGIANDASYKEFRANTFFIGMQVITFRTRSCDWTKIRAKSTSRISDTDIRAWYRDATPGADCVIAWKVHQKSQKLRPIDWGKNDEELKWELIPCHLFCFKIRRNNLLRSRLVQ